MKSLQLSVVIPAYNAADWLKPTTKKLSEALEAADIVDYEIIIIDDGSRDTTKEVAESLHLADSAHIKVQSQVNSGRYITRKRGVELALYDRILFIDTRVWLDIGAIAFVKNQLDEHPERSVWNGHINVAKKGNIIARFGDALTLIGWRRYFRHPRLTSYGIEDFDHYPKGTGLFSVPKNIIESAFVWFEANTTDIKNSSDDTLLIRHISETERIWLSPDFSATYFARTTINAFIKHTYNRGQFFVDGFLRRGTRFFYPLIAFLFVSIAVAAICAIWPSSTPLFIIAASVLWILSFGIAILLGLGLKDAGALLLLSPLFVIVYGAGIWKATLKRIFS